MERVMIVGVIQEDEIKTVAHASLKELQSLVKTAGGYVQATSIQHRPRPDPATYIGKGKAQEVKEQAEELDVALVIVNGELSPSQGQSLSARIGVPVIDRTQLILDIFASRAQTREGRIQVELAQLTYLLPRLRGQGTSLSRLGGGIGTRGPGETKLETDRRHIRRRMDELKKDLTGVQKHRSLHREQKKKSGRILCALVGYTNAGKTTLLNALTEEEAFAEDLLFATLDPLNRELRLPSGMLITLSDTVGFIRDLPTTLIAAFRATLEEVANADMLIHVIDATSSEAEAEKQTVERLLKELGAFDLPILTVLNKAESLHDNAPPPANVEKPWVYASAKEKKNLDHVLALIEQELMKQMTYFQLQIPASEGDALSVVERTAIIQSQHFDEEQEAYVMEVYAWESTPQVQKYKN